MILRKKMRKQTKIFKKAINAKWAFYWAKFMTEAATICRKYTHEVIEGKGTDHEYTHPLMRRLPIQCREVRRA